MKNVILIALFILKVFKFSSWFSITVGKGLDNKDKVNFKINDVTNWEANNYSTHIIEYYKK